MPPPISETVLEQQFIGQLENLKYAYRMDIRDRASLHKNFRDKFESLFGPASDYLLTDRAHLHAHADLSRESAHGRSRAATSFGVAPVHLKWLTTLTGRRTSLSPIESICRLSKDSL